MPRERYLIIRAKSKSAIGLNRRWFNCVGGPGGTAKENRPRNK